jgi:hypothetical protein
MNNKLQTSFTTHVYFSHQGVTVERVDGLRPPVKREIREEGESIALADVAGLVVEVFNAVCEEVLDEVDALKAQNAELKRRMFNLHIPV